MLIITIQQHNKQTISENNIYTTEKLQNNDA